MNFDILLTENYIKRIHNYIMILENGQTTWKKQQLPLKKIRIRIFTKFHV